MFSMSFTAAKISIADVNEVYSLGDIIYVTVVTTPTTLSGFFEIDLVCGSNSSTLYKVPAKASFSIGEEQTVTTNIVLIPSYIEGLLGECHIITLIGNERVATKSFTISKDITLTASLDKASYSPEEKIILNIEARKTNGNLLEGFLEVSGATYITSPISKGQLTETFLMPKETEAKDYQISIFVHDKDEEGTILNNKNTTLSFEIVQVPKNLELSLTETKAIPGEYFEFGLDLYDQTEKEMAGTISTTIYSPDGEEQITTPSGEIASIEFPTNAVPGDYALVSKFEELEIKKEFTMQELQKVEFDFLGSILSVKNIGNVAYTKPLEITIGGEIRTLNVNIPVGQEEKFNLRAPEGNYEVSVSDGDSSIQNIIPLTGKAISIDDIKGQNIFSKYPLVLVFITILILLIAVVIYFKFMTKRNGFRFRRKLSFPFSRKLKEPKDLKIENISEEKVIDATKPEKGMAESNLVLKGEKSKSAIISIRIDNQENLTSETKNKLSQILELARERKGMVEIKGNHIIIVFSPLVTRTFKNELSAAKLGLDIHKRLKDHNKKFKDKIGFNIGINTGDLIASLENKKLKYTGMGNTTSLAKKISDNGYGKLLVSENVRKQLLRDLRTKKAGLIGKSQIYEVESITDTASNKEKLKEILKRMEREEKFSKKK